MANILGKSKFYIFLYNLTLFKRILLSLLLFLFIYLFFYTIKFVPLNKMLSENKFILNDLFKKEETLRVVLSKRDLLIKEIQQLSKVNIIKNRGLNLAYELTNYSLENLGFKVLSMIKKENYNKKTYELKIRGNFNDFILFFKNYLISNQLLKIKKIDIENVNKKGLVFCLNFRLMKFL